MLSASAHEEVVLLPKGTEASPKSPSTPLKTKKPEPDTVISFWPLSIIGSVLALCFSCWFLFMCAH